MEVVNLYKIGSEQFTPFYVTSRQPIGDQNDWQEKLQRVEGYIDCQGVNFPISLVSKSPCYKAPYATAKDSLLWQSVSAIDYFCLAWERSKRAGVSVAPTLRLASATEVMMTDFCRGGGCLYDKFAAECVKKQTRKPAPTDLVFMQLNFQEIEEEAESILARATKAGIALPYNDPLNLVVYPNGRWHLVTLDWANTMFRESPTFSENRSNLLLFKSYLSTLKEEIRGNLVTT